MNEDVHVSMDKFANQTEDFVANWLKENGLEKLVDIFKRTTIKVFDICVEIFYISISYTWNSDSMHGMLYNRRTQYFQATLIKINI